MKNDTNPLPLKGGVDHFNAGRLEAAEAAFRQALERSPDHPDALHLLGLTLSRMGRNEDGAEHVRRALDKQPGNSAFRKNLGQILMQLRDIEGANECYERVLAAEPGDIDALIQSGILKAMAGDVEGGDERLRRAATAAPADPRPRYNLGVMRLENGEPEKAAEYFRETVYLAPKNWEAYLNWGRALTDLAASGGRVLFHCDDRMVPVYGRSLPAVTAVSRNADPEAAAGSPIDFQIPLEGLGAFFRATIDSIPGKPSIITADPDLTRKKRAAYRGDDDVTLVGVSWLSTNRELGKDKAIDLARFSALPLGPGVRLIDLQYGDTTEQRAAFERETGHAILHDDDFDQLQDLESFAARVAAMDAVVSVSSTTAHFAGGLGVPAFVMLNTAPLHYWFLDREDSPWYPSLRLFRQRQRGQWDDVLAAVGEALQSAIDDTGSP